jgi:hypothetical protein
MKNDRGKMKSKPFIISRSESKLNDALSYVYLRTSYGAILHYSDTEKPAQADVEFSFPEAIVPRKDKKAS